VLASESGGGTSLSAAAERLLLAHAWPGNLRQMRHVLRSAVALADGKTIGCEHLPTLMDPAPAALPAAMVARTGAMVAAGATETELPVKLNPIQANERQVLLQLLEQHRWNVSNVAKALDVSRNTLYRKLHKLHIEVSHPD
jgi:transcriptional regulator of acetoin/glycerol metabolism